ncbi:hypothetical protein AWW66_11605 [Micromonospora rosaria]|uniref:Uncharacterized protein n=1 Tax=Micromonospora rosaria TaxID=47874 RepID=A0A136PTT3_9ACTN|nr:hypothetical protein [Micromonospora rosaria]KXK61823.1 hypothetical protein AWW66_11605 [Micromonospora rosaria]
MTSQNAGPVRTRGRHRRHRLADRTELAAEFTARYGPAVAEYALAARDLVERCPEIGPIDTWSRLADAICGGRPEWRQENWRKRLSRHFTTESKGPPWQTVVLVAKVTVPEVDRRATLDDLARLHRSARGDWPPAWHPADDGCPDRAGGTGIAQTAPGSPESPELARLRRENAVLHRQLAASQAEIERLRAEPGRDQRRGLPRRQPPGPGSRHRPAAGHEAPGCPPHEGARAEDPPRGREAAARRDSPNSGRFPAGQPTVAGSNGPRLPIRLDTATPRPPIAADVAHWVAADPVVPRQTAPPRP